MDVASFAEIEAEFSARVRRIVWCTAATVDTRGRPRTRVLHPVWEGASGWVCSNRHTPKEQHLAATPFVSLVYWDPQQEEVRAECRAGWETRPDEKHRVWEVFKSAPPPYGYDPAMLWKGPDDPKLGLLKLVPVRIELCGLADFSAGRERRVWRSATAARR